MANSKPTDLVAAIEEAALAKYGELLAPELAHAAARSFSQETAEMVEDLLEDSAAALRDRIEGQLQALTGGKPGKKKPKKKTSTSLPAPAEAEAEPEAEVVEAAAPAKKRGPRAKAS